MIKRIFESIEGLCQAVTYLFLLFIGLVVVGLGAYTVFFLAIRIAQLLWFGLFQERWL